MKISEQGVLSESSIYFHTAGEAVKELFFYPLCAGHFDCDGTYAVKRQSYDSFLALYVINGKGFMQYENMPRAVVPAGSLALVDCYKPHLYGTMDDWEILWMHFDGELARKYFDACTQCGTKTIFPGTFTGKRVLQNVLDSFRVSGGIDETMVSMQITELLTELYSIGHADAVRNHSADTIDDSIAYIAANLEKQMSLDTLSGRVNLSPFYFSRLFKKKTGSTPHEYILQMRIEYAKYLLKTTNRSIKDIGFSCGFQSECGFCASFKKRMSMTPLSYRNSGM